MYWNINEPLSYNCLFNFIVGARGVGKTYGCKEWAIKDYLKNGKQFVYVRRYKEEFKKVHKFFDDIKDKFPEHQFGVKFPYAYIDGTPVGNFIALSTAKIEKSTPFPDVNKIIYDEFILDKGYHRYLPDEVTNYLELYSTVARDRDDVIAMFLSNALTITNPYFIYFNLNLPYGKSIKADNDILIQIVKDKEYMEKMEQTRFGKIISGTKYGDYAIGNEFFRDNKNFVQKKTAKATYQFCIVYKGEKYGVWFDYSQGLQFVSNDYDLKRPIVYSFTMDDHTPNTFLLANAKNEPYIKKFINNYKLGVVRFESINIKNVCAEIIKMTM